jgi:hypothetical protein
MLDAITTSHILSRPGLKPASFLAPRPRGAVRSPHLAPKHYPEQDFRLWEGTRGRIERGGKVVRPPLFSSPPPPPPTLTSALSPPLSSRVTTDPQERRQSVLDAFYTARSAEEQVSLLSDGFALREDGSPRSFDREQYGETMAAAYASVPDWNWTHATDALVDSEG